MAMTPLRFQVGGEKDLVESGMEYYKLQSTVVMAMTPLPSLAVEDLEVEVESRKAMGYPKHPLMVAVAMTPLLSRAMRGVPVLALLMGFISPRSMEVMATTLLLLLVIQELARHKSWATG